MRFRSFNALTPSLVLPSLALTLGAAPVAAQCELVTLDAPSLPPQATFASLVATSGRRVAIALDDGNGSGEIATYLRTGLFWQHDGSLPIDDALGMDLDGELLAVRRAGNGNPRIELWAHDSGYWFPLITIPAPDPANSSG